MYSAHIISKLISNSLFHTKEGLKSGRLDGGQWSFSEAESGNTKRGTRSSARILLGLDMICYILDDQYGKHIYQGLSSLGAIFPIQDNVRNHLEYIDEILAIQPDFILLDNYFPNRDSGQEEPLEEEFLKRILDKGLNSIIICISDYGSTLITKYDNRKRGYDMGIVTKFIASKNPKEISHYIKESQEAAFHL